jgi:hypothetical protein
MGHFCNFVQGLMAKFEVALRGGSRHEQPAKFRSREHRSQGAEVFGRPQEIKQSQIWKNHNSNSRNNNSKE